MVASYIPFQSVTLVCSSLHQDNEVENVPPGRAEWPESSPDFAPNAVDRAGFMGNSCHHLLKRAGEDAMPFMAALPGVVAVRGILPS